MSTALADQLTLARWRVDRMAFRREAVTLEGGRPFGECMEPWQHDDFAALDSGEYQHAYLERARGHSKTFDIGSEAVTELLLGRPGQRLFCAAADEDQARLLFEDVADKFRRSPLLRGSVRIMQREIVVPATGSRLRVLSSDAPTAYGLRPDWIAVDELAEWRRRELWDSLWTATGKRSRCRMLVITTAGFDRTSICWEVRQNAEREPNWFFSARGRCASWISEAWLEQQRRTLPAHVFARLHESRWVEGAGAFLLESEVDAIFAEDLPEGGGRVAIGLDLGWSRDRAAAAAVRADPTGAVVIDRLLTWTPTRGGKIDLTAVEDDVLTLARRYGAPVIADQWEAKEMSQRLQRQGVRFVLSWASSLAEQRRRMFSTLLDLIRAGRLRARYHERLRHELLGLEVKESGSGWRVDHRPSGHDDTVIAVALAAHDVADQAPVDFKGGVILGPPRASSRAPTSSELPRLPRHSDENVIPRIDWRDSPWGR